MHSYTARLETVGDHLVGSVLHAAPGETAEHVRARMLSEKPASVELVLVRSDDGRFAGVVPIVKLLSLRDEMLIEQGIEPAFPAIGPDADQEHAASLAVHHRVDALPVVDAEGRPLGVMPAQALMQVLRREHVEDLHVLAGMQRETAQARHAIEDPPLRRVRHRLPWLLAGLAGSGLATAAMAGFESRLSAQLAIAFFVPGIVYLADAIGTQSQTIAVRGLSLTHAGIGRLLAGELRAGLVLGGILGLVSYLPILLFLGNAKLAAAVSTAIFAAGTVAAGLGLFLPWVLARARRDPALGSGPLATIVQDIVSLLVYLGVVSAFGL